MFCKKRPTVWLFKFVLGIMLIAVAGCGDTDPCRNKQLARVMAELSPVASDADLAILTRCADSDAVQTDAARRARVGSAIWLGYIYMGRGDNVRADKYINIASDVVRKNCDMFDGACAWYGWDEKSDLAQVEAFPAKFKTQQELYTPINLFGIGVPYTMVLADNGLFAAADGIWGSSRDGTTSGFVGRMPDKYRMISVDAVWNAPGYVQAVHRIDPEYYAPVFGTMRFAVYKARQVQAVRGAMAPDVSHWDAEYLEQLDKMADVLRDYPDVWAAVKDVTTKTSDYYRDTFAMDNDTAKRTAYYTVLQLITHDFYWNWGLFDALD